MSRFDSEAILVAAAADRPPITSWELLGIAPARMMMGFAGIIVPTGTMHVTAERPANATQSRETSRPEGWGDELDWSTGKSPVLYF